MADMKRYRLAKGLTQRAVAQKLKVSIATVCRWESGKMPEAKNVPLLAKLLGIEPLHLTEILSPDKSNSGLISVGES